MATIIQGERYALEIVIKSGETPITPSNADDVKIKIGSIEKTYRSGELTYDDAWLFPLTQEETLGLCDHSVNIQAQYRSGSNVYSTPLSSIKIDKTIIRTMF